MLIAYEHHINPFLEDIYFNLQEKRLYFDIFTTAEHITDLNMQSILKTMFLNVKLIFESSFIKLVVISYLSYEISWWLCFKNKLHQCRAIHKQVAKPHYIVIFLTRFNFTIYSDYSNRNRDRSMYVILALLDSL